MASSQNFRSAFNGFNREDVVNYLEYLNTKHQNQVNQLTAEAEELRAQLAERPMENASALVEILKAQVEELKEQLAEAQERCQELEAQKEAQEQEALPAAEAGELDAYRRAERMERIARERSELVYHQASGVLTEAVARVDGAAAEITDMADQVMTQITRLQVAVSGSKQALQDAASLMNAIRPNK